METGYALPTSIFKPMREGQKAIDTGTWAGLQRLISLARGD